MEAWANLKWFLINMENLDCSMCKSSEHQKDETLGTYKGLVGHAIDTHLEAQEPS